ncbi:MAG: thioredoxin-dependent thiol peroxidase [Acidimicrobiia bacterium]|nr:MAG: thioredoxin-dependent thiol peroxidase [Acidimicrobiia bacterium]
MRLETGAKAPTFTAIDQTGSTRHSSDFAGKKLVVYFYPKAFTPGCTTESCDFGERHETFTVNGYTILGISPDTPKKLSDFKAEYDLPFDLLSDPDNAIASNFGAYGMKKNYGREYMGIIRSTFLIDEKGIIEQAFYNVRAKGHVERMTLEVEK